MFYMFYMFYMVYMIYMVYLNFQPLNISSNDHSVNNIQYLNTNKIIFIANTVDTNNTNIPITVPNIPCSFSKTSNLSNDLKIKFSIKYIPSFLLNVLYV